MMNKNNGEHSLLGPSTLQRRFLCPGSYELEKLCDPESSDSADRGSALHKEVASALRDGIHHEKDGKNLISNPLVSRCINIAHISLMSMDVPDEFIEIHMNLKKVHPLIEKGTIDFLLVEPFNKALITDWKFTVFEPTPAKDNLQLASYAVGVAKEYGLSEVQVMLYLPELDKYSEYTYDLNGLVRANNRIQEIVEGCQSVWAPLNPSQNACRFCRAWSSCPAALATAKKLEELTQANLNGKMQSNMSDVLKVSVMAEGIIKRVKQNAFKILCADGEIEGAILKQIRGKRTWKKEMNPTILRNWGEDLDKNAEDTIVKQEVLPSPAALEKAWGKSKPIRDKIDSMTEMENKGKRLEINENDNNV